MSPVTDVAVGEWVVAGLAPIGWGEGTSITCVVPAGFEAYARILHPASSGHSPVRWATVAAWAGRQLHGQAQWESLSHPAPGSGTAAAPWDQEPWAGPMDPSAAAPLVRLMARCTTSPEHCFFATWDGYGTGTPLEPAVFHRVGPISLGGLLHRTRHWRLVWRRSSPPPPPDRPLLVAPDRSYLLSSGPLSAILGGKQLPDLWWPADRAWVVAADVDLDSTYVGASQACIDQLLQEPELEVVAAGVDDRVDIGADTVNRDRERPAP